MTQLRTLSFFKQSWNIDIYKDNSDKSIECSRKSLVNDIHVMLMTSSSPRTYQYTHSAWYKLVDKMCYIKFYIDRALGATPLELGQYKFDIALAAML